jgi:5'-methylthioadenosine phosphorylase
MILMDSERADIAIIGGTAMIDPSVLDNVREIEVVTPYGRPSDAITLGELGDRVIAFLPRHGKAHNIPPHLINFKANIDALSRLGVKRVIATATVGSLQEQFRPGEVMVPDQFIDWSKNPHTFVDDSKVFHVSLADPFCPELRSALIEATRKLGYPVHEKGTYVKIDGPQFSTRAASHMYRKFGDVIGMTSVPEAILSMERGMCPAIVATVTDYDCWRDSIVIYEEVKRVMAEGLEKKKAILLETAKRIPLEPSCPCKDSLSGAEA